jgi:hypothetical protein
LAEWLGNFPEWVRENSISIVAVTALIIVIAGFFLWWRHNKYVVQPQEEVELTNLLGEIPQIERQIVMKQNQGTDVSHFLLPQADRLKSFAETERKQNMAALALIQQADALRAELHYRLGTISQQDLAEQIGRAKASYTEAITRAPSNPSFVAAAKFGLGLCAEEVGDFNEARKIYQEVASNPDFEGTVTIVQVKNRLDIMSDYENNIVFKPAPKVEPKVSTAPKIQIKPLDSNLPIDMNLQFDVNLPADMNEHPDTNLPANTVPTDVNLIPQIPGSAAQVPDINLTPIPPDSVPEDSDVNVPVE